MDKFTRVCLVVIIALLCANLFCKANSPQPAYAAGSRQYKVVNVTDLQLKCPKADRCLFDWAPNIDGGLKVYAAEGWTLFSINTVGEDTVVVFTR